MIKFIAGNLLGLGLSEGNIRALKMGNPIHIDLREIGQQNLSNTKQVLVFYGETEDKIKEINKEKDPEIEKLLSQLKNL